MTPRRGIETGFVRPIGAARVARAGFILIPLLAGMVSPAWALEVYEVEHAAQADLRVYREQHSSRADLRVHWVQHAAQAAGDARWHRVRHRSQADRLIHFVGHRSQADLVIVEVEHAAQAGWNGAPRGLAIPPRR
jgi:hypothetical protein